MIPLPFIFNDGGRAAAGFKGTAGDCVTRAVAIATSLSYQEVYDAMAAGTATERKTKRSGRLSGRRTARDGIHTKRQWFKDYMAGLGWKWTPTMAIGSGCKVHLAAGEVPMTGRVIVAVSKHYTTVVDGVIHDAFDPQRETGRCVYGYWSKATT